MAKYTPQTKNELEKILLDFSLNLADIDTSAITDMAYLFKDSNRTDFSGIERWDTSSVVVWNVCFKMQNISITT